MGLPLEKRHAMRNLRIAIKAIVGGAPDGINYRELTKKIFAALPDTSENMIKRQVFKMTDNELKMSRAKGRHALYFLVDDSPEPPADEHVQYRPSGKVRKVVEKEIWPVIQRTVPAATIRIPVFRKRSPMQWCVDVMAGVA